MNDRGSRLPLPVVTTGMRRITCGGVGDHFTAGRRLRLSWSCELLCNGLTDQVIENAFYQVMFLVPFGTRHCRHRTNVDIRRYCIYVEQSRDPIERRSDSVLVYS